MHMDDCLYGSDSWCCCLLPACLTFQVLDANTDYTSSGRTKSASAWKLFKGKSTNHLDKLDSPDGLDKANAQPQLSVPLVEALFLPDFPVKSKDTDYDVRSHALYNSLCLSDFL